MIDVGVSFGTSDLYDAFAGADILLIEPVAEFEPALRRICERYKAQYVLAAASDQPGRAFLNVHGDQIDCSSLLRESEGSLVDGTPREVPTVTVDEVCLERKLLGPYLVKVDVQGAELKVLDGARGTLKETELVILEVSLFQTMIGGPQLHNVVLSMKERGFVTYNIFGFLRRPLDDALAQIDMAFVREDGPFRRSHWFATPDQRRKMAFKLSPDGTPMPP